MQCLEMMRWSRERVRDGGPSPLQPSQWRNPGVQEEPVRKTQMEQTGEEDPRGE